MFKNEKKHKKGANNWAKIHKKSLHKSMRKKGRKKRGDPGKNLGRRNARNPQRLSFQKTPSEENREESQLKLANKVECKKWSAKGTYRKASADREPTTHLNTLGAYGHVRI